MLRAALILVAIAAFGIVVPESRAAWPMDGVVLPGDANTPMAADGRGGMFFAYDDTVRVFLGHLEGEGGLSPGGPITVATAPAGMSLLPWVGMARDSEGGVVIAWAAYDAMRRGQLFLTRVLDDREVLWTTALTPQASLVTWWPAISAGDSGDVYAAWSERPDSVHVMLARLTRDGRAAVGWPSPGVEVAFGHAVGEITLEPDGLGGAVVGTRGERSNEELTVERVTPAGVVAWAWTTPIYYLSWGFPRTAPDGMGGVFLAWVTKDGTNIVAQHLSAAGVPSPGWPDSGIPLKTFAPRWAPDGSMSVCPDDAGGMFLIWSEVLSDDVFAQHLRGDGRLATGWPVGGLTVSGAPDHQELAVGIPDGSGGVLVAWEDWRYRVEQNHVAPFVQRIAASGHPASGWYGDGVCLAGTGISSSVRVVSDGTGGAFVGWGAYASDRLPMTVQRVSGDGVYGPLLDQPKESFQLMTPFPIPFRTSMTCDLQMVHGEETQVEILDIGGRRIRSLVPGQLFPAGSHRLRWDGQDDEGIEARPGVYFLHVHTPDASGSARIVKVR